MHSHLLHIIGKHLCKDIDSPSTHPPTHTQFNQLFCVYSWHTLSIQSISFSACNITECREVQEGRILMPGIINPEMRNPVAKVADLPCACKWGLPNHKCTLWVASIFSPLCVYLYCCFIRATDSTMHYLYCIISTLGIYGYIWPPAIYGDIMLRYNGSLSLQSHLSLFVIHSNLP